MKNGGGQFAPILGGHFKLESGGHFKLELGGQYDWNLQQSKEDELHLAFTEIMKKTRNVSNPEMETLFKDYIEHAYSIINLINMDLFK